MTSDPLHPQHPVLACAAGLHAELDQAAASSPVFLSTEGKREALVELARARSRLVALELSVLAVSGDIAEAEAARDPGPWLAAATRQDPGPSHRRVKLAQALDARWTRVAEGLAGGVVNPEQATVVVAALERLTEPLPPDPLYPERGVEPRDIPAAVLAEAEAALVEACAAHAPRELRVIGEKILQTVAPSIAEQDELRRLEREERRAAAATRLTMRQRGDGSTDITGRIPDAYAARLRIYLRALTAPRHDATSRHGTGTSSPDGSGRLPSRFLDSTGKRLPADRVLGEAFCQFLDAADPDRLPIQAGAATKVIVTLDLDTLLAERGTAHLADGTPVTAGTARRLACQAGIIPAVLGGPSEVLDLGREHRFFSTPQRTALALAHPVCRAEHCTIPAAWCEAHHKKPWSHGGRTDLNDGALLCPWHHQRAHDLAYTHHYLPNGDVRYHKRR